MGCPKLTYLSAERHDRPENTLYVVNPPAGRAGSERSREANVVQMWLSVDPLAEEFLSWIPLPHGCIAWFAKLSRTARGLAQQCVIL